MVRHQLISLILLASLLIIVLLSVSFKVTVADDAGCETTCNQYNQCTKVCKDAEYVPPGDYGTDD